MNSASLFWRLFAYLVTILFLGPFALWFFHVLVPTTNAKIEDENVNDFVAPLVRQMVIKSLVRRERGGLALAPNAELSERIRLNPFLRYAVIDSSCHSVEGSSSELIEALPCRADLKTAGWWFRSLNALQEPLYGVASVESTPFGQLLIAIRGYQFLWRDLPGIFIGQIHDLASAFGPIFLIAPIIALLAVRRGLSPLSAASLRLNQIDVESINHRLPVDDFPSELRPFILSVNEALVRLDAGVAKQKRFVANAAHQLMTPIAILRARLDNPDDNGFRQEQRRDVRRLQAIVEQLLAAARISERDEGRSDMIDLAITVRLRIADYAPLANASNRSIDFEGPSSGVMIRADRQAIESVFDNLLDNALRAEPDGGVVIVRQHETPTIEIVDHGVGVPEENCELIFEPFWRKSEATPGAGLGLAIAKEIIEAHGGRIRVGPTPGGGATFVISLQ